MASAICKQSAATSIGGGTYIHVATLGKCTGEVIGVAARLHLAAQSRAVLPADLQVTKQQSAVCILAEGRIPTGGNALLVDSRRQFG